MLETLAKYVSVFLSSSVKFIFGPIFGTLNDLSVLESAIFTVFGMMTTVVIIMFFGDKIKHWADARFRKGKRLFTPRNRTIVKIWSSYGLAGIAFLTPVLFSPIGGAFIALLFGGSKRKVFKYMFVSAVFWAFTQSFIFMQFGHLINIQGWM